MTGPARVVVLASLVLGCSSPPSSSEGGTTTKSSETGASETSAGESSTGSTTLPEGPPPDVQSSPECDFWAQDCPPGEKCVPWSSTGGDLEGHRCVPVLGDDGPGEPCLYAFEDNYESDSCDASSYCWDRNPEPGQSNGVCRAFCSGSPDQPSCTGGGSGCTADTCAIEYEGYLALCLPNCDPLAEDCPAGKSCMFAGDRFACLFVVGDPPDGEACGFFNDCLAGSMCVDAALLPDPGPGAAYCASYCDLSAPSCSLMGTVCQPAPAFIDMLLGPDCSFGLCLAP